MVLRRSWHSSFACVLALTGVLVCGAARAAKKKSTMPVAAPKAEVVEQAPVPAAPNVLFIIADDLNDWVGWLGGHPQARTPNMDRLARLGMRFTNAHCSFALCNPSRTSLLTGMLPSSSGVFGNEQDWRRSVQVQGRATLPEHFRACGFLTAAGGKIFHANHGGPEGRLAGWHGGRRGFECDAAWSLRFPQSGVQIPDLPVHTGRNFNGLDIWHWDWGAINVPDDETDDGMVASWAAGFLSRPQDQPFFLAVGLYRPHSPWYVPQKYFSERPPDDVVLPELKADDLDDVPAFAKGHLKGGENYHARIVSAHLWQDAVRAYLASVTFCDAMLGRVIDALLAGPHARNTVVVFTSDHGWYLGQKQMWHKGRLWEEATHVPLTILAPGATQPGSVSGQPVSLIDLYPTLCDLALLPTPAHLDGVTLLPLLRNPALKRERPAITTMGGAGASYAARDERWRYIRYADGTEELYDHAADPHEWTNLAAAPAHAATKKTLESFFPAEFKSASRLIADIAPGRSADGGEDFNLQGGDELAPADSPQISGKGVFIDAAVDFSPAVDGGSTILAQGDAQAGYALHFVDARPTLSVFLDGKAAAVASLGGIAAGRVNVRGVIGTDGTLSLSATGGGEIAVTAPFTGGFPAQPAAGLKAGQSFGILSATDYPDSTPFDGAMHRVRLTVFPPQNESPPITPAGATRPDKTTKRRTKT